MTPHPPETFAPEPDWKEFTTGNDVEGQPPSLLVHTDGPQLVRQYPTRLFSTVQLPTPSDGRAVRAAGFHPARSRLHIQNLGPSDVYIAPEQQSATPTTGFLLTTGAPPILLETSHEVWMASVTGQSTNVSLLAQYQDG